MNLIHIDSHLSENKRRYELYHGELFITSPDSTTLAFRSFASGLIHHAFGTSNPETVQHEMDVEEFVSILKVLKPEFIHHPKSKQFIQSILQKSGCDMDKTYFDVPRLRTSTSNNYVTSGIASAFHPHRDTWFSAPMNQINWWMPVFDMDMDNCLALHPAYWDKAIKNTSGRFSYNDWIRTNRKNSADHVTEDKREQPMQTEKIDLSSQLRISVNRGGMVLFSGAHLHSSVPNYSGKTCFSIDFKTIQLDDLLKGNGARNIDTACQDLNLGDFLRASDFEHLPEELTRSIMASRPVENGEYSSKDLSWTH